MVNDKNQLDAFKVEFEQVVGEIRKILASKPDKNQLSLEEKRTLRTEYLHASNLAKKIAERSTNSEESAKFKKFNDQLKKEAERYGSVIQTKIPETTLNDVKGLDNVKKLVHTFLFMAKNPSILQYYKIKGGLGLLMYGAPGTGKTMIAEAIANEMKLPLLIVTPADIFKSYVGESEQAVKQIFEELDACPDGAILFVDECESIFSKRTSDTKDYKSAVTTELLQRINGFGVDGSKRILIGATNRPDLIDSAYLRYKRFSHLIHVTPPDLVAKRAIIEGKLSGIPLEGVTTEDVLEMSEQATKKLVYGKEITASYFSSADICAVVEEACRIAMERLIEAQSTKPIPLTKDMFELAFKKIVPSIPADLLEKYDDFRNLGLD